MKQKIINIKKFKLVQFQVRRMMKKIAKFLIAIAIIIIITILLLKENNYYKNKMIRLN